MCALLVVGIGCGGAPQRTATGVRTTIRVSELTNANGITRVTVTATPGDVSQDLTPDVSRNGAFSGALVLPPGDYSITASAYAGTQLAATGTSSITVVLGGTVQLTLTLKDATGPAPTGGHAPIITSFLVPSSEVMVGDQLNLSSEINGGAADPTVILAWSVSPAGCGTFSDPGSAAPVWTAASGSICTITLTASSARVATTDSRSAYVRVMTPVTSGNVQISTTYLAYPNIRAVVVKEQSSSGDWRTVCGLERASDATCSGLLAATPVRATVFYTNPSGSPQDFGIRLSSSCGADPVFLGPDWDSVYGDGYTFTWNAPVGVKSCLLTAYLTEWGWTDSLPVALVNIADPPTFTVTVNVQGSGRVFTEDGKIDCGSGAMACSAQFSRIVVLKKGTSSAYFNGWCGDCQGTGDCTLSGNADKFAPRPDDQPEMTWEVVEESQDPRARPHRRRAGRPGDRAADRALDLPRSGARGRLLVGAELELDGREP